MAWGLCRQCHWWQIEPDCRTDDGTVGVCTEDDLRPFQLRVMSNCGCNEHMTGEPGRAKGASQTPPVATSPR